MHWEGSLQPGEGAAGDSPRASDAVKLYFTRMFVCFVKLLVGYGKEN